MVLHLLCLTVAVCAGFSRNHVCFELRRFLSYVVFELCLSVCVCMHACIHRQTDTTQKRRNSKTDATRNKHGFWRNLRTRQPSDTTDAAPWCTATEHLKKISLVFHLRETGFKHFCQASPGVRTNPRSASTRDKCSTLIFGELRYPTTGPR